MKIINPATNELIKEVAVDTAVTCIKKYDLAKIEQKRWAELKISERVEVISKFAELIESNKDELAKELTMEVGKPLQESLNEISGALSRINYFVNNSEKYIKKTNVNTDGNTKEWLDYDPLGVIANISAWNYPFLVGVNVFIPALICGNAVMYKPSEFSTLTGMNIVRLFQEAGLAEGLLSQVIGEGDVGKVLLDLPLDGYFFTGSVKTGQYIAKTVAEKLVPVGLELGGKDPLYVTEDIESIAAVAESVGEGAFYNNGQSCCSVERVYVHHSIYEEFVNELSRYASSLTVGDPMLDTTSCGPITRSAHLSFLSGQIEDAISKGAKKVCGGEIKDQFITPAVFRDVNHSMSLMVDETFGPLIGVQSVKDDDEAVFLMNDTKFGLTSSVFCRNKDRGENLLSQIDSGTGYLNCCDRISAYLPWSGRGNSGLGSTLSQHGLYSFCKPKGYQLRM